MGKQPSGPGHVCPRQARSRASVDAILEAATQILEAAGEAGFNTNAIAERAGVGIASLYRYFPNKRAILVELGRREMRRVNDEIAAAMASREEGVAPDRLAIRLFLHAFGGRTRARRAVVTVLLQELKPAELQAAFARAESGMAGHAGRPISHVQAFVLSRALLGVMRSAVLEGAPFLLTREFEDELVHLARAYAARVADA